jgi:hypothetical protein
VIVTTPAALGAVNVTAFPEVLLAGENPPPLVDPVDENDHVTPWLPVSLVSVAVTEIVRETVNPPRFGLTETVMLDPPPGVVAEAVLEYPLRFPAASLARTR